MKIATASKKTSKNWKTYDITWEKFLQKLRQPHRTGETMREYRAMDKAGRDAAKEAAGGFVAGALSGPQRKTGNVTERSMITLDADNAKPGAWELATLLCNFRMCSYTTHSHTDAKPRLRWIIPTDRPMTPDEYPAVARRVAEWLDIDTMDATTYELARLMFWPTCSSDGPYVFREQEGPLLRVDDVLHTYGNGEAWKDCNLWPMGAEELTLRKTAAKKAGEPTEKPGMVGLFCRAYDVPSAIAEFLSDVYAPCGNGGGDSRYTYLHGSTAGGAVVYNDGAFLYSNHATDPCGGRSVNAFDLVRIHKFGEQDDVNDCEDVPVTQLPSYRAMVAWCAQLPEIKEQMVADREAEMAESFRDLTGISDTEEEQDTSWQSKLELNRKTGECEQTVNNALLILSNDSALKDCVGYDLFTDYPELKRDVPWRRKGEVTTAPGRRVLWGDRDDAGLRWYMQHKWLYDSRQDLSDALELVMQANSFHPVRDYLNSLTWDGVERLDTALHSAFGTEVNAYTSAAFRKWLTGAVARVMQPGAKFDCALVLVGKQGIGKSTFANTLSKGWFNDSIVNMGSKDGYDSLRGSWIIELSELSSLKRSDMEAAKAFITARSDTYRGAYERRAGTHDRQCVFIGSTNETEFLRDRTGSRRFWPVDAPHKLDVKWLNDNVDQLWAEAVVRYRQGEFLDLETGAQKDGWDDAVKAREVADELLGQLIEYLDTPITENWYDLTPEAHRDYINGDSLIDPSLATVRRDRVCITEIRVELLGEDRRKRGGNDQTSRRLANLMNNLPGWKKSDRKNHVPLYGPQWVYYRE